MNVLSLSPPPRRPALTALVLATVAWSSANGQPARYTQTIDDARAVLQLPAEHRQVAATAIELANLGEAPIEQLYIWVPGRDWQNAAAIVRDTILPGDSQEAVARRLWLRMRLESYAWWAPSQQTREGTDPAKLLGVYGYGLCTQRALALAGLWRAAGLPVRFWRGLGHGEHDVPEVFYDGSWHLLDPDRDVLVLLPGTGVIAGVEDLLAKPDLLLAHGDHLRWLYDILRRTPPGLRPLGLDAGIESPYDAAMTLLPAETVRFEYEPRGAFFSDLAWGKAPPVRGLAKFVTPLVRAGAPAPTVVMSEQHRHGGTESSGVAHTVTVDAEVRRPFPVLSAEAVVDVSLGAGDRLRLDASRHASEYRVEAPELARGEFRDPGVWVSDENLTYALEEQPLRSLYVRDGRRSGQLSYRMRRQCDEPVELHGTAYRFTEVDGLTVSVSADDGATWEQVWSPNPTEVGSVTFHLDLSAWFVNRAEVRVRFDLHPRTYGVASGGWTSALHGFRFTGVVGPLTPIRTVQGPFSGTVRVPLSPVILPPATSASYGIGLRVTVESTTGTGRVEAVTLETHRQASPAMFLPLHLAQPPTEIAVRRQAANSPLRVQLEWDPASIAGVPLGTPIPAAPVAPVAASGDSVIFSWLPATATGRDVWAMHHVQLCADAACEWPLGSDHERYLDQVAVGTPAENHVAFSMGTFELGRRYYWRVRSRSEARSTWGPFGQTASFVVAAPLVLTIDGGLERTSTNPFIRVTSSVTPVERLRSLRWEAGEGRAGLLIAASAWRTPLLPLRAGTNHFRIVAESVDGVVSEQVVTVRVEEFTYYLAEGDIRRTFDTMVVIANPGERPADVGVRWMTGEGGATTERFVLQPWSRRVLDPRVALPHWHGGVGAQVTSFGATALVVERVMEWGAAQRSAHAETAMSEMSRRWHFAEGAQGFFDTFFLVVNPSEALLDVQVGFLLDGGGIVRRRFVAKPSGRLTIWTRDVPELVGRSFATIIEASQPFVAERAMYFGAPAFAGGHSAAGIAEPSSVWTFAEGATGPYFDTYLLIANPHDTAVQATVTYLLPDGTTVERRHRLDGMSRTTIAVEEQDPLLRDTAVAFEVRADAPVVAERAMYWPGHADTWSDAHASAGATQAWTRWALAAGESGGARGAEHFVLLSNSDTRRSATVRATVFRDGVHLTRDFEVTANSRMTVAVDSMLPGSADLGGYSIELRAVNDVPFQAEGALYWNSPTQAWSAGVGLAATPLP